MVQRFARPFALSLLVLALSWPAMAAEELRIVRITPDGTNVESARQIVLEFNRPVVPIGKMDRTAEEVGVTITPALTCQWRWLNTSALACNLSDADQLKPATAYKLHIEPVIKAEDGATIAATQDHSFTTRLPDVEGAEIETWNAPGTPVFRLYFNMPVTKESIEKHLYFVSAGSENRVAVAAAPYKHETEEQDEEDAPDRAISETPDEGRLWIVKPVSELPLNTGVSLIKEAGLATPLGEATSESKDIVRTFYTFPELALRGVVCYDKDDKEILLTPDKPQAQDALCNPLGSIALSFTSPVLRSQIAKNIDATPDIVWGDYDTKPAGQNNDWSRLSDGRYSQNADFRINLPYPLKAAQEYTITVPEKKISFVRKIWNFLTGKKAQPETIMVDEFDRSVPPFTIKFATGHRNPNYEMLYKDAVLEKGVDSEVPLYVNNLKDFSFNYKKIDSTSVQDGTTDKTILPVVEDKQFAVPAGIRTLLNDKSGAVYSMLQTTPDVKKWAGAARLFAQVTPYQVYAKMGHFRSAIWVTDLATGQVVPDAKVTIYKGEFTNLRQPEAPLVTVQTDANGIVILPGTEELDPDRFLYQSWKDEDTRLFVRVDKGEDMALLPLSYDYEVMPWNIATDLYVDNNTKYGHMKSWGMTAQGIYRAGDTMQYKIYVRNQDNNRFVAAPDGDYTLEITDPAGKSVDKIENIKLSAFGTIENEYKIPPTAAVGWYNFKLTANLAIEGQQTTKDFYPLTVLVSDFTPAPFRVSTELNGDKFKAGDTLDIVSDAKLHSGGAYGDAAIRTTITLKSRYFSSKNPKAQGYSFDSFSKETSSEDILQKDDKLDDKGEWKTAFTLPEKKIVYGQLIVESAVRDDRGKSIANAAQADYTGVDRLIGLKPTEWVFESGKPAIVKTIVVDTDGNPVAGTPVALKIEKEEVVTAKVKSAGNAYTNDNTVEWKDAGSCSVTSADEGVDCAFTPPAAGTYRITGTIKDTKGRDHSSAQYLWVTGSDYVQWNDGKEYALTIIPEKTDYKVGDTARYLVKNPWPGVNALVTVERYGVMDSFVQKLDGSAPVIEIPVKPDYVPGFYVSVVAMSPRVDAPPPEMGQVDMGKPAFRAGYVQTDVTDSYKLITVTAKADQDVYRPRDKVKVSLDAKPLNATDKKEPIQLAVAVLDESVFDLISAGKTAFDPYEGFYSLDALDVSNYSLLTRLIGRQKFEKKGANPGGDGGVDAGMRNVFKFVSYWNPSIPVDANGHAEIEFEAPDNLTGWRILALAVTPNDLMGLGDANFKVNRPTEIRPVMPNQVHEGDTFDAGFSVMNRTDKPRTIKVTITATGDLKDKDSETKEETITLEPYKRATVLMPLETKFLPVERDLPQGTIAFSVTAGDENDSDGVEHSLPLLKSRTIETAANYGSTTEDKVTENIAVPKDIYTDSGDISVVLSTSVIAGLDGAFKYMRDYAYPCWEQKLTMAAMASNYNQLKPYLDETTTWDGADKLPQTIIDMASSYQAPNGGMAYYIGKDEYTDPYLSAYTALAFGWLKDAGYKIPVQVEENLQKYLLNFLRNDAAPDYYQDGMKSTVRAVILAALAQKADQNLLKPSDIERFRPHLKQMSLFGQAHFLKAALLTKETPASTAREAANAILSSGVESGGKLSFNETYDDGYDRILATPVRDNCAVLDALATYAGVSDGSKLVGDKPMKIIRFITQARENRDHFENTQENMFCLNALVRYAQKYERVKPDMKVLLSYQGKPVSETTFKSLKDQPQTITRPLHKGDEGTKGILTLDRKGDGRLYYATRLRYAPKEIKDSVNAGVDIRREYSIKKDGKWVLTKSPIAINRGDLVKVDLYVSIPTARNFLVVNDPLPGGLETVNRDLATASSVDADQALYGEAGGSYWFKFNDWNEYNFSRWSFYHKELRHDSARFYSDWLEPGNYHLSYMAQAVATGTFSAPPVKAEEMYDPDVYGIGVKEELVVKEAP